MKLWRCYTCGNQFLDGIKYIDEDRARCGLCVNAIIEAERIEQDWGNMGPLTLEHERAERARKEAVMPGIYGNKYEAFVREFVEELAANFEHDAPLDDAAMLDWLAEQYTKAKTLCLGEESQR